MQKMRTKGQKKEEQEEKGQPFWFDMYYSSSKVINSICWFVDSDLFDDFVDTYSTPWWSAPPLLLPAVLPPVNEPNCNEVSWPTISARISSTSLGTVVS